MSDYTDIEGSIIRCGDTAKATVTITFTHTFEADKYGEYTSSEDALIVRIYKALRAEGITDMDSSIDY